MRAVWTAILVVMALGTGVRASAAGEDDDWVPPKPIPHEPLRLPPERSLPPARQRRIRALIGRLAGIESFRGGLTPWGCAGGAFRAGAPAATPKPAEHAAREAWRELVVLGPDAMPFLLEHLDDATPTKYHVEHDGSFGAMWCSAEVDVNVAYPDEGKAVESVFRGPRPNCNSVEFDSPRVHEHTATIGDCCFVILGQITNRRYEAVRYQPTACVVVNSPTTDPRIALAVRAQWAGRALRSALAERLLDDLYTTCGVVDDGGQYEAEGERQSGAASRLLTWYADAAEVTVLARLESLRAAGRDAPADGYRAFEPLVRALAGVKRPKVERAVRRIAYETEDVGILEQALPGLEGSKDPRLLAHVRSVVNAPDAAARSFDWRTVELLHFVARHWPGEIESVLREHIAVAGQGGVWDVVDTVHESDIRLPTTFWRPLLDLKYKAVPWERSPRHAPIESWRVCDFAAHRIALSREGSSFDPSATVQERDAKVAALRKALDAKGR